jgi:hypothetical protein
MNTIHLDANQVPANMRGSYTGKKFKARVCETITIPADAGLWSGGSRETYHVIELESGHTVPAADHMAAPWDNRSDNTITLKPGYAVVMHSMFCGKDMGLTFYLHSDNAAAYLPAPSELSDHERLVLIATRSYKSSYGGQDRYQMMQRDCEYKSDYRNGSKTFPSRSEWDAAKASLVTKELLDKRGAITVKGRNAIGNER